MPTIYKDVEVEVDVGLDDFDDDELIAEMERRGLDFNTKFISGDDMRELITRVWQLRREGREYQAELDQLIWYSLGKIV
jgi:hypothetical protein